MSPKTNNGIPLSWLFCSFAPRNLTLRINEPRRGSSRGLTRLLVGGRLNFDFGRGIANFALELIPPLLEFPQGLAKTTCEFGKPFPAEEQHRNDKNEDRFWPAGHAESDWGIH